jgi:hypothetical protein
MDTQQFDALARRLGAARSRRRLVSALLVGTLGQMFHASPVDEIAAKGRNKKKKKKKRKRCPNPCPPETPCCFKGACQPLCGGSCCADCFVEILLTGQPNLDDNLQPAGEEETEKEQEEKAEEEKKQSR